MPKTNTRYNISQQLVTQQIEKKIAELECFRAQEKDITARNREAYAKTPNLFTHAPWSDDDLNAYFDECIKREREHYTKVRVIYSPKAYSAVRNKYGGYLLVYGDTVDAEVTTGTGPFEKLTEARNWFLNGGR